MENFNQFADSLDITFACPHCHEVTSYHLADVPAPNWSGDTAASSENCDDDDFCCEHCEHPYTIDIYVNIMDGVVVVTDAETHEEIEDVHVEEHYIDEEDEGIVESVMNT